MDISQFGHYNISHLRVADSHNGQTRQLTRPGPTLESAAIPQTDKTLSPSDNGFAWKQAACSGINLIALKVPLLV